MGDLVEISAEGRQLRGNEPKASLDHAPVQGHGDGQIRILRRVGRCIQHLHPNDKARYTGSDGHKTHQEDSGNAHLLAQSQLHSPNLNNLHVRLRQQADRGFSIFLGISCHVQL